METASDGLPPAQRRTLAGGLACDIRPVVGGAGGVLLPPACDSRPVVGGAGGVLLPGVIGWGDRRQHYEHGGGPGESGHPGARLHPSGSSPQGDLRGDYGSADRGFRRPRRPRHDPGDRLRQPGISYLLSLWLPASPRDGIYDMGSRSQFSGELLLTGGYDGPRRALGGLGPAGSAIQDRIKQLPTGGLSRALRSGKLRGLFSAVLPPAPRGVRSVEGAGQKRRRGRRPHPPAA